MDIILNNKDNSNHKERIKIKEDTNIFINYANSNTELTIETSPNTSIRVLDTSNNTKNNITYNIDKNVNLTINKLSIDCSDTLAVNIKGKNANVSINNSIVNYKDNIYTEKIIHCKEDSKSDIVNHALNMENNVFRFIVDGVIEKNTSNTYFSQENQIINYKDGDSQILPNLIVNNNDIEANHSAYVGSFKEDYLFYLMTRGISKEESIKLLTKAFLINSMRLKDEEEKIFNDIINSL